MPKKRWIIVCLAAFSLIAVLVATQNDEDREVVDALSRRQQQASPSDYRRPRPPRPKPRDQEPESDLIKLASDVTAWRESYRAWVVNHAESPAQVALPFAPTSEGLVPDVPASEDSSAGKSARSESEFLGADACASCHADRHRGFIETAHHKTSGLLDSNHLHGHYEPPGNVLKTSLEELSFTMHSRGDRYFQTVSLGDWSLDFPIGVFTGSAKSGQSFLYWHGDGLYQTHVSYLSSVDQWVPSPGFDETRINYTRPIRTACLECHMTSIELRQAPNLYHRDSAIWGISCERCHGPGRSHVEFHEKHPEEKKSRHIVHPSELSRRGQLDLCGQCHSGSFELLGKAFSYRPGDELQGHHKHHESESDGVGGIHTSNQLPRLAMSKCFQNSEMTCTTCHNPHQNQRGKLAVFTQSCLSCHQPTDCGMSVQLGAKVADNCISCHMPAGSAERITMSVMEGSFTMSMIDHYIRVDRKSSEEYLAE